MFEPPCVGYATTCDEVSEFVMAGADFFFSSRRRHTSSLRDWSSDVCSSDLPPRSLWPKAPSRPLRRARLRGGSRSEERRVGKECRSRWSRYHQKKNKNEP